MTLCVSGQLLGLRLELDPFGGWLLAAALAVVFVVATAAAARRTTQAASRRKLFALWILRGGAALAILFVLARPSWVSVATRTEEPLLAIMRDTSQSMTIRDEPGPGGGGPASRIEAADRALEDDRRQFLELAEKYDLVGCAFSDRLVPLTEPPGSQPAGLGREAAARRAVDALMAPVTADGRSTRLGDCLRQLHDAWPRRRIAAVILLSDGRSNLSDMSVADAARLFGKRSTPIYTVGFGSEQPTGAVRDVIARSIDARPTVFVGNRIDVAGEFRFHGLKGRKVGVQLLVDGQPAAEQTVDVPDNRYDHVVRLPYQAEKVGSHKLELVGDAVKGEAVAENNRISTSVDVLEGGLPVLLVQESPLVEGRFIFAALRQSGQFDCRSVVLSGPSAAAELPATTQEWRRYKAVVLIDVPAAALGQGRMTSLAEAVASGDTGFLMAGGERSFGSGGYAGTKVAEMLPVRISPGDGFVEKAIRFRPTAVGLQSGILQLEASPADSDKAWQSLPELPWANRVGQVKATAEVFAEGEGGIPLLVAGQYGGRVLALTVASTWRWQLGGREEPPGKNFKRLWRQLLLYLTGHAERDVWVSTNEKRFSLPDLAGGRRSVQVTAGLTDRQSHPVTDAECVVTVAGPGGRSRTVRLRLHGDIYTATLDVTEVGDYEVRLSARRGGEKIGEATTRFVVYEPHPEWEEPLADMVTLEEVSHLSSGRRCEADRLGDLLADLAGRDVSDVVTFQRRAELWDNRYVLGVFALLLSAEWVLRKRWGLV